MSGYFSIENNLLANTVNLELSEHQQSLGTSVRDLSSGLRVNSAADDPSGNAIATSLQSHAQAFNQASDNVSEAQNAATVADGALAAVTDILLRIRELAVGAASSVDSSSDRVDIQAEIGQLLDEINRIAQDTNFNGRSLLDGSIAGNQPAQNAQTIVTANSILMSSIASGAANSPASYLVASLGGYAGAIEPTIMFGIAQNVVASSLAQTVQVDSTEAIKPGAIFEASNGTLFTVQSVDAAADTITAVFSRNITQGSYAWNLFGSNLKYAVSAGTHIATLANPAPLYSGEPIQLAYTNVATNDVVIVQQVLSSTSFIATFNKPQVAGALVFAGNEFGGYGAIPAGVNNYSFGPAGGGELTDGAPIGSTAYVVGVSGAGAGTVTKVLGTGTVVGGSITNSEIDFPNAFTAPPGGYLLVLEALGFGSVPLLGQFDGTIQLTVVDDNGTIGAKESFYDTATQTSETSQALLAPGQTALLFDGVSVTLGDFGEADVGSSAYIKVLQSVPATNANVAPPLTVQSGSDEGDVVQIGIPAVNTNTLRISATTVIGASGSDPTLAAEDAIGQLDYALQRVTTVRAYIGASIVRLGIDQTNDDTAATELTASQSNITDLNVGPATTEFTAQQIDIDVATSMLAQVDSLSKTVLELFENQGGGGGP